MNDQISSLRGEGYYDFIIAGAGCAGLSLALHFVHSGKFNDKKILIVDKEEKNKNDRTWCFWEKENSIFEPIVFKSWEKLWFYSDKRSRLLHIDPYRYKMIRGVDFYDYCLSAIRQQKNFTLINGQINKMSSSDSGTYLFVNDQQFSAQYIFNSILFEKPELKNGEYYLKQHFNGWVIETEEKFFNPDEPTLMDFRVRQNGNVTFVYMMPFSETKALVEYTLFSDELLEPHQYVDELKDYISKFLKTDSYKIVEEEFGIIPMTNHQFLVSSGNIINIGSAGGQTKPSSGYTFQFIQKHSAALTAQLVRSGTPFLPKEKNKKKFHFYDSTLLHILHHKKLSGKKIFTDLFTKNKPQQVLRFMDNESSLTDELKIISSLPVFPFLKAALQQL